MRKKGENSVKCAGKSAIPPDKIIISPLISKVNPSNFSGLRCPSRDCSVVEGTQSALQSCETLTNLASGCQCLGCGRRRPRGLQLLTARVAYWGLGFGGERNTQS